MTKSVGFICLGVLGSVMATNLLKDGFSVLGYDIRAGVLKKLKDLGIKAGMSEDDFSLLYKKFHKLTEIDQKL